MSSSTKEEEGEFSTTAFNKLVDELLTQLKKELTELQGLDEEQKANLLKRLQVLIDMFSSCSSSDDKMLKKKPQQIFTKALMTPLQAQRREYRVETSFKKEDGEVVKVAHWYKKMKPVVKPEKGCEIVEQNVVATRLAPEKDKTVVLRDLILENNEDVWTVYSNFSPLVSGLGIGSVWKLLSNESKKGIWQFLTSMTMFCCTMAMIPPEAMPLVEKMAKKLHVEGGLEAATGEGGIPPAQLKSMFKMFQKGMPGGAPPMMPAFRVPPQQGKKKK
jgi:hypothetical protein